MRSRFLSEAQSHRLRYQTLAIDDEKALDVRSVAFVMAEMLTGLRIRGNLMEKTHLLDKIDMGSLEYQFLSDLLAPRPLEELLEHSYFSTGNPTHPLASNTSQEQRQIVDIFIEQESKHCRLMQSQYRQQFKAWQAQFETRYKKKPEPVDRPASIIRLEKRLQALKERINQLTDRLTACHSQYQMQSSSTGSNEVVKSTEASTSDSIGRHEGTRSPAQKAFLNQFHFT